MGWAGLDRDYDGYGLAWAGQGYCRRLGWYSLGHDMVSVKWGILRTAYDLGLIRLG